ncbi:hypothetical protein [Clostridium butyricum]
MVKVIYSNRPDKLKEKELKTLNSAIKYIYKYSYVTIYDYDYLANGGIKPHYGDFINGVKVGNHNG